MITQVRLAISETSETMSDAQILRLINQSYLELAAALRHAELDESTTVTLVDGTAEYDLEESDILHIENVTHTTEGVRLQEISTYQYDVYTQSEDAEGTPAYYFLSGWNATTSYPQITFFPTPDAAGTVTIRYRKKPTELVTTPSATSAIINEIWDDSIVYRAISRAWMLLGDSSRAAEFRQMAQSNDAVARRMSTYASVVPIRPGSRIGVAVRNAKV
jgi:hypothetical protein